MPRVPRRRIPKRSAVPFPHKLVLKQWLLGLFNLKRFEDLAEHLRTEALEGLDENNVHHFHHALTAQLFDLTSAYSLAINYASVASLMAQSICARWVA